MKWCSPWNKPSAQQQTSRAPRTKSNCARLVQCTTYTSCVRELKVDPLPSKLCVLTLFQQNISVSFSLCSRFISSQSKTSYSEVPVWTEWLWTGQHFRAGAGRHTSDTLPKMKYLLSQNFFYFWCTRKWSRHPTRRKMSSWFFTSGSWVRPSRNLTFILERRRR